MDEVELTGTEAASMNRIAEIDAEIDAIEKRTTELVEFGARGGAGGVLKIAEDKADVRVAQLHAERAELVVRLKRETGVV